MGVIHTDKTISEDRIPRGGSFLVTLSLTAAPDLREEPLDAVLVLDVSGSMTGLPLEHMKAGAAALIDRLAEASGGETCGNLGGGSRVGVIAFSDSAEEIEPLTADVCRLKKSIRGLRAGGGTAHAFAFSLAQEVLRDSESRRVLILFTDGVTSVGPDPDAAAEAARQEGIEIYCVGLNTPPRRLAEWASAPVCSHIARAACPAELERVFSDLGREIIHPGAREAVILEELCPEFAVTEIRCVGRGEAEITSARTIRWALGNLGTDAKETASLTFAARHVGEQCGELAVNRAVDYRDRDGQRVIFPSPGITVEDCGPSPVVPEPCPEPVVFHLDGCQDCALIHLDEGQLGSPGRVVSLEVTLRKVCPNRRVALAVFLTETDSCGREQMRGRKTLTVPAHEGEGCRDVRVSGIRFVLPEDLTGTEDGLCGGRTFRARMLANYIDGGGLCCEEAFC